jgi:hypothetical protein
MWWYWEGEYIWTCGGIGRKKCSRIVDHVDVRPCAGHRLLKCNQLVILTDRLRIQGTAIHME